MANTITAKGGGIFADVWNSNLKIEDGAITSTRLASGAVTKDSLDPQLAKEIERIEKLQGALWELQEKQMVQPGDHVEYNSPDHCSEPCDGARGVVVEDFNLQENYATVNWISPGKEGVFPINPVTRWSLSRVPQGAAIMEEVGKLRNEQAEKLKCQQQQIIAMSLEKQALRSRLESTSAITLSLSEKFDLAMKKIEELEAAGKAQEARRVEDENLLPVLYKMSTREKIKAVAKQIAGTLGRAALSRILRNADLEWILSLFT